MGNLNRVEIIGRLGNDPETRYTQAGAAVTNISVATSERWKDKQTGEPREETEWHRIVFFGKQAEVAGEYLRKGSLLYCAGKLKTRKWQDQSGQDRYTTEIHARELQFLSPKPEGAGHQGSGGGGAASKTAPGQQATGGGGSYQRGGHPQQPPASFDDFDDDIPF